MKKTYCIIILVVVLSLMTACTSAPKRTKSPQSSSASEGISSSTEESSAIPVSAPTSTPEASPSQTPSPPSSSAEDTMGKEQPQTLEEQYLTIIDNYFIATEQTRLEAGPIELSELDALEETFLIFAAWESPDGSEPYIICGDDGTEDYGKKLKAYEVVRTFSLGKEYSETQSKFKESFAEMNANAFSPEVSEDTITSTILAANDVIEVDCKVQFEGETLTKLYSFIFIQHEEDLGLFLMCTYDEGDDVDNSGGVIKYYMKSI